VQIIAKQNCIKRKIGGHKMKKFISAILAVLILCTSIVSFAAFTDVPEDIFYKEAIEKVSQLGIMSGDGFGAFRPDEPVTREEFAKIIVVLAELEGQVNSQIGIRIFDDVDPYGWSGGYINVAWSSKYIASTSTWNFSPKDYIAYADVCKALIKVLGYEDKDLSGLAPYNYIEKSKSLGISEGITLGAYDAIPRWALAVMINRLFDTKVKNSNLSYAEAKGFYTPCIILGNSITMDNLSVNQVLTDKGIYYLSGNINLEIGKKYGLKVTEDTIYSVYNISKEIFSVTVDSILGTRITYKNGTSSQSMVLPNNITYYYKGQKVANYDSLSGIIKSRSKIVFTRNSNNTGYEYAVIIDPVYSKPEIAINYDKNVKKIGNIDLSSNIPIIKNGDFITPDEIAEGDVLYLVSDIDNNNKYIYVSSNKVEGRITGFIPSKLSPQSIVIENKTYDISSDMNVLKITSAYDSFKINDYIIALLGHDNKIVDIMYPAGENDGNYAFVLNASKTVSTGITNNEQVTYNVKLFLSDGTITLLKAAEDYSQYKGSFVKYSKDKDEIVTLTLVQTLPPEIDELFSEAAGLYTECIILGDATTTDKITERQIITDKGIYYLHDTNKKMEIGSRYKAIIDGDSIIKVYNKTNTIEKLTVKSAIENRIEYTGSLGTGAMVLPEKTVYYYNGAKISSYDSIKNLLQPNTSIILAYNADKSGFEYGIIYDPVYSEPVTVKNFDPSTRKIGNIEIEDMTLIIRNGETVSVYQIEENDVAYLVTDIWGGSKLVHVVDKVVEGQITAILPSSLAPKYIQIDGKNYEIGKHFDIGKLSRIDGFKVDDYIEALMGYDGKIADLIYGPGEYVSKYAYVLNTSKAISTNIEDFGKEIYYVKLLLDTGAVETYRTLEDYSALKGTLIQYVKIDEEKKTIGVISLPIITEIKKYPVNKNMRRFGDGYVSDDVKIFNYVSTGTGDAFVYLIKWEDLPEGAIPDGKVLYVEKDGEFNDIVLICLHDIFNEKQKTAIVKSSEVRGSLTYYSLLIDGKEYTYVSGTTISNSYIGSALSVGFENNTITHIKGTVNPEVQSTSIRAIDAKRVRINDSVYLFKNNITIYYKDYKGDIKQIGINDIDLTKTYGWVAVYLDKPGEIDGRAEVIFISE